MGPEQPRRYRLASGPDLLCPKRMRWACLNVRPHSLLQLFGWPKRNLPLAPDMDNFAGPWVQAPPRRWPLNARDAETGQANRVPVVHMAGRERHQVVKRDFGLLLREIVAVGQFDDRPPTPRSRTSRTSRLPEPPKIGRQKALEVEPCFAIRSTSCCAAVASVTSRAIRSSSRNPCVK